MNKEISYKDIKHTLLSNKKFSVISFFVLLSIFVVFLFVTINNEVETKEEIHDIEHILEMDRSDRTNNEQNRLDNYLFEEAYFIRFFIEDDFGNVYNRSNLLLEILSHESIKSMVEERVDIEVPEPLTDFIKTEFNSNNVVLTVSFGTGNVEVNKKLALAYYDVLENEEIEFLEGKNLYFLTEPTKHDSEKNINDIENENVDGASEDTSILKMLFLVTVSIVFSIILTLILVYFKVLKSNTVSAITNLRLNKQETLLNLIYFIDKNKSLNSFIEKNNINNTVILSESNDYLLNEHNNLFNQFEDIDQIENVLNALVIVKVEETSKQWFMEQIEQLRAAKISVNVIKF